MSGTGEGMPARQGKGEVQLGGSHAGWSGECTLGGLLCYSYGADETVVQNVAAAVFVGLVIAWALAIAAVGRSQPRGRLVKVAQPLTGGTGRRSCPGQDPEGQR